MLMGMRAALGIDINTYGNPVLRDVAAHDDHKHYNAAGYADNADIHITHGMRPRQFRANSRGCGDMGRRRRASKMRKKSQKVTRANFSENGNNARSLIISALVPHINSARLSYALRDGLAELGKRNEEYTERLEKAIEAIKPKPVVADKDTSFWNSYRLLADEHDKEFHQKYSSDLDTALIFIQPELQPGSDGPPPSTLVIAAQILLFLTLFTTLLAALLAVLGKQWLFIYGEAGNRGTLEERGLERQRKLDGLLKWKFELILQMFPLLLQLALFLFWAALSVYLWAIQHSLAVIMIFLTAFGSMIYIAVLISAMIYPDSPFQTPLSDLLAGLIKGMSRIFPPGTTELISALYRNTASRFWTWFSTARIETRCFVSFRLPRFYKSTTVKGIGHIEDAASIELNISRRTDSLDDIFEPRTLFDDTESSQPSPAIPAILWLLETCTNPDLVSTAATVAVDLQWPVGLDLGLVVDRLRAMYVSCFDVVDRPSEGYYWRGRVKVREDSVQRAINFGKAFAILQISSGGDYTSPLPQYDLISPPEAQASGGNTACAAELRRVFNILEGAVPVFHSIDTDSTLRWVLAVMPHTAGITSLVLDDFQGLSPEKVEGLNRHDYADYLFCINRYLGLQPSQSDIVRKNKRPYIPILLGELFFSLTRSWRWARRTREWRNLITENILSVITRMTTIVGFVHPSDASIRRQVDEFCASLIPGGRWVGVILSALKLLSALSPGPRHHPHEGDILWIYKAFAHIHTNWAALSTWTPTMRDVVVLLFKELAGARSLPQPSEATLRFVVKVLAQADDASPWAFVILCKARDWFRDHEQWRILREYPVWAFMGRIALTNPQVLAPEYLEMANTLSEIPEWASDIRNDPTSWFMIQHHTDWRPWQYTSVLKRLWDTTNAVQTYRFKEFAEEALARTLIALTNIWGIFDDSAYSIFLQREDSTEEFIRLATCTVEIAFRPTYTFMSSARPISPLFRMTFLLPLGNALMKAAVIAKRVPSFRQMDRTLSWERPAALLHEMGTRLAGDHAPPPGSAKEEYWREVGTMAKTTGGTAREPQNIAAPSFAPLPEVRGVMLRMKREITMEGSMAAGAKAGRIREKESAARNSAPAREEVNLPVEMRVTATRMKIIAGTNGRVDARATGRTAAGTKGRMGGESRVDELPRFLPGKEASHLLLLVNPTWFPASVRIQKFTSS
ncbi:hypothetical protein B0H11DRAFT_2387400 [Mycena galericulata]|nr:hypothetical protein B0H11DRAFT_2387400 [Mycena galericulata]